MSVSAYVSAIEFLYVSVSLSSVLILSVSLSASVSAPSYFSMFVSASLSADKVRHGCLQTSMPVSAELWASFTAMEYRAIQLCE